MGSALTAGHFWKRAPKVTKRALAPTLGTSPRLGVPVIRQGFGGPPPRALHGAGRLNRHPCRFTPQIPVEFRPACLMGRLRSKARSRSRSRAARFASHRGWGLGVGVGGGGQATAIAANARPARPGCPGRRCGFPPILSPAQSNYTLHPAAAPRSGGWHGTPPIPGTAGMPG